MARVEKKRVNTKKRNRTKVKRTKKYHRKKYVGGGDIWRMTEDEIMAEKKNSLQVLGLGDQATYEEIKNKYRKLAKQYHPDKGGERAEFQSIASAYDFLTRLNEHRGAEAERQEETANFQAEWLHRQAEAKEAYLKKEQAEEEAKAAAKKERDADPCGKDNEDYLQEEVWGVPAISKLKYGLIGDIYTRLGHNLLRDIFSIDYRVDRMYIVVHKAINKILNESTDFSEMEKVQREHSEYSDYFPYLIVFGLLQWMFYALPNDFKKIITYYSDSSDYSSHFHFLQCWERSPAVNAYRYENQRRLELVKLLFDDNADYICNGEPFTPNYSAVEGLILRLDIPETTPCRICGCFRRQFSLLYYDDEDGSRE